MKRLSTAASLIIAAALATCADAGAETAKVAAASNTRAASNETPLLVRYAVVVGSRTASSLPKVGQVLSDEELADYLSKWNPDQDNTEIRKLFALRGLSEVVRQAASLPADGGDLSGAVRVDGVPWRVELAVRARGNEVRYEAMLYRGDELISAPQIISTVGDRAIVSATGDGIPSFFFVVVQSDRATGEETRPASGAASAAPTSSSKSAISAASTSASASAKPTLPKLVHRVDPDYPESEKAGAVQGLVVVALEVGADGAVRSSRVVQSLGPAFDAAALAAVNQWRFEPGQLEGKPVATEYRVTINFVPGSATKAPAAGDRAAN